MIRWLRSRSKRGAASASEQDFVLAPEEITEWADQLRHEATSVREESRDLQEKYQDVPMRRRKAEPKKTTEATKAKPKAAKKPAAKKKPN